MISLREWGFGGLLQFDRPVRLVQERLPGVVLGAAQPESDGGISLWLDGLANKPHGGLSRGTAALAGVALHAGADEIGPGVLPALDSGRDVVKREFARGEVFSAVLAATAVTSVDVAAIQFDRSHRATVVFQEPDDPRYGNDQSRSSHEVVALALKLVLEFGDVRPGGPIVVAIGTVFDGDHFSDIFHQQAERTTGIDNSDGGIEPIEDEYL